MKLRPFSKESPLTRSNYWTRALSLHKQVLERNEHIFTPNTFDTRRNPAFLYRKTGEIEKALKFLKEIS